MEEYLPRDCDSQLRSWMKSTKRDVLLVRGARQVGKSSLVRKLGEQFEYYIEANFEEEPDLLSIFSGSRNPAQLCEKISAFYGKRIEAGKTLLFLDEIQACEDALHALRFFKEKMPDLHVIAAGSLLEFALNDISTFGVGRITSVYIYPLSFGEFLESVHSLSLRKLTLSSSQENPFDKANHHKLLEALRVYQAIGGLPEIVSYYKTTRDLSGCQMLLERLIAGYEQDFAKYKSKVSPERLRETFVSIANQSGKKFVYSRIGTEGKIREYKSALEALVLAGLAHKVYHTSASGLPLGSTKNSKKFKIIPFDVGILQRLNDFNLSKHITLDAKSLITDGVVSEVFAGTELVAYHNPYRKAQLYYWHRESPSSNAEVDYLLELDETIVPLEIKAKKKGGMKSLRMFFKEKNAPYGIRSSHENFGHYENIKVIPIVALEQLFNKSVK